MKTSTTDNPCPIGAPWPFAVGSPLSGAEVPVTSIIQNLSSDRDLIILTYCIYVIQHYCFKIRSLSMYGKSLKNANSKK